MIHDIAGTITRCLADNDAAGLAEIAMALLKRTFEQDRQRAKIEDERDQIGWQLDAARKQLDGFPVGVVDTESREP